MSETFVCELCHQEYPLSEHRSFDSRDLCASCWDSRTVLCDRCGERIWSENDYGEGGLTLCERCREDYGYCRDCGRLIPYDQMHYLDDDDDEGYCEQCFCTHTSDDVINSYYFKPAPLFYGEGSRFFGVELEIDGGGETGSKASRLLEIANSSGRSLLYVKHDGSLDDGLELVSHPMSLSFHTEEMPWKEILRQAACLGYTSHQARTCGLHVHVNRTALGDTETEQEPVIARILFFVENHWNELLRFSRRTWSQMEQWAARYGRKDDPKAVLDHAKRHEFARYKCVNLTNADTIEFRMFRGTLKWNSFLATLQMVDRICDVALFLSDQEVQDLTWTDFAASCTQPELVQYLKERRLYVNEPVAAGEELEGSFAFSVLDSQDNLYLVKGNNPLTLYRFPSLEIYLYASTEEILDHAIAALGMEKVQKEDIPLSQGDILRIDGLGERTLTRFNDTRLCLRDYYRYGGLWDYGIPTKNEGMDAYLEEVVNYAISQGIPERELRLLVEAGYDAFDLEELLSDPFLRQSCVQEILCDIWG